MNTQLSVDLAKVAQIEAELGKFDLPVLRENWRVLAERGVLVSVHIGRYRGVERLTVDDLGIDLAESEAELVDLGNKYLLPKDVLKKLNTLDVRARQIVARFSYKTIHGWFVPVRTFSMLEAELKTLEQSYRGIASSIVDNYAQIKAELYESYLEFGRKVYDRRETLGLLQTDLSRRDWAQVFAQRITDALPNADQLRASYRFELKIAIHPLTVTDDQAMQSVSPANAQDTELASLRARAALEYQSAKRQEIDGFLGDCKRQISNLIADTCNDVILSIGRNGALQSRSIVQLRNLIESLETLNFWGDAQAEKTVEKIKALLAQSGPSATLDANATLIALRNVAERVTAQIDLDIVAAQSNALPLTVPDNAQAERIAINLPLAAPEAMAKPKVRQERVTTLF